MEESALNEEHGCWLPLAAIIRLSYIISIAACYTHNTGASLQINAIIKNHISGIQGTWHDDHVIVSSLLFASFWLILELNL